MMGSLSFVKTPFLASSKLGPLIHQGVKVNHGSTARHSKAQVCVTADQHFPDSVGDLDPSLPHGTSCARDTEVLKPRRRRSQLELHSGLGC